MYVFFFSSVLYFLFFVVCFYFLYFKRRPILLQVLLSWVNSKIMRVSLCEIYPERCLKNSNYTVWSDNLRPFDKCSTITIVMHFIDLFN